ncbi:hypothetical protein ACH5RR_037286 [Cinchona calisaya]|uniref:Uncharacterized protein n=1 Tax=Cinchona calisaya TaxID=153742 RepID=A0ABD2Y8U4_9GENT
MEGQQNPSPSITKSVNKDVTEDQMVAISIAISPLPSLASDEALVLNRRDGFVIVTRAHAAKLPIATTTMAGPSTLVEEEPTITEGNETTAEQVETAAVQEFAFEVNVGWETTVDATAARELIDGATALLKCAGAASPKETIAGLIQRDGNASTTWGSFKALLKSS